MDIITKNNKINVISTFLKGNHSEDTSNELLSIIDNHSIDYTINCNGIFINLNVIDDYLLNSIYDYIVTNHMLQDNVNNDEFLVDKLEEPKPKNTNHEFVGVPDAITYTKVDLRLLSLSKKMLTI